MSTPDQKTSGSPVDPSHPLFNRSERRLREIVDVCMGSHDGMPLINVLLSRVPAIGEEVAVEARIYRVIGVQHSTLDLDGRAAFGTHAHLTVVEVPDVDYLHRPESPALRRTRRKKSRRNPAPEREADTTAARTPSKLALVSRALNATEYFE